MLRLEQFCARWRNLSAVLARWEQAAARPARLPQPVRRAVRDVDAAVRRLSSLMPLGSAVDGDANGTIACSS
jgi:hypothetical protein